MADEHRRQSSELQSQLRQSFSLLVMIEDNMDESNLFANDEDLEDDDTHRRKLVKLYK